jgi:hypothetical protein
MTNPVLTTLEGAAAPSLVQVLTALQTFVTNLGTDPSKVALTFPGAAQVLLGTIELQGPALLASEFTTAQSLVQSRISAWIASVQKLEASAAAPTHT